MYENIKATQINIQDSFNIGYKIFINNIKFLTIMGLLLFIPLGILFRLVPQVINYVYNLDMSEEYILFMMIGVYIIALSIYSVIVSLIYSAITSSILEVVNGNVLNYKKIIIATYKKLVKHIITSYIYTFIVVPMFLLLIIPGIYFGVSMIFFPCFIAITDKWGFVALRESRKIVKGNWFKTFGFLLLLTLFSNMADSLLVWIQNSLAIYLTTSLISYVLYFVISRTINVYFIVVFVVWFLNKYHMLQLNENGF